MTDETIDCSRLLVIPAGVDMHVHMRGGVQSAKEDWATGTRSAVAGGVTVVVDQPNTIPPLTTQARFLERVRDAQEHSICRFAINSAVTPETQIEPMWQSGAMAFGETFVAPSSYGEALGGEALRSALERIHALGSMATIHTEEVSPGPDTDLGTHNSIRSSAGELRAVGTVNNFNTTGCQLHFCHLSTALSIDAAAGSVEVTPHHLLLSWDMFDDVDAFGKVNPPLRDEQERRKLWSKWDKIDLIASDHAPHTVAEKRVPFENAPSGIPGVETMIPLLLAKVLDKTINLHDLVKKTSLTPAQLLGVPPAGFLPGDRADFAIYPKIASRIDPDLLHSKCGWTPFTGQQAVFPDCVIMNGKIVYRDREFSGESGNWIPGKGYQDRL